MEPTRVAAVLRQMADQIDRSKNPDKNLVAKDLRRILAALRVAADVKDIEQALYNHSGAYPEENQGSSIWWLVFDEMDMTDWTPVTNYAQVEAKAKELLQEWSKGWHADFTPEEKQSRIDDSIQSLKKNWATYRKSYMPEHIKILQEKGLMPGAQGA